MDYNQVLCYKFLNKKKKLQEPSEGIKDEYFEEATEWTWENLEKPTISSKKYSF